MFPTEPVPAKIGAYKVIRRLTSGGLTRVYLARSEHGHAPGALFVLKVVPDGNSSDAIEGARELAREAAICEKLNHAAIARTVDCFEHEEMLVVVLDHVEGTDLSHIFEQLALRRARLTDRAAFYIGHQLAGVLAHAHMAADDDGIQTPVIHRNLHPSNVLIGSKGDVRLTGFGMAKIEGRTPETVVGMVKGSPGYMAPEQLRGERVTPRADVYGCGLLLWSALTGRSPPQEGPVDKLSELRPDLPPEVLAALETALEPSPSRRRITCLELEQWFATIPDLAEGQADLRRAAGQGGVRATLSAGEPKRSRRKITLRNVRRPVATHHGPTRASLQPSPPPPSEPSRSKGPASAAPSDAPWRSIPGSKGDAPTSDRTPESGGMRPRLSSDAVAAALRSRLRATDPTASSPASVRPAAPAIPATISDAVRRANPEVDGGLDIELEPPPPRIAGAADVGTASTTRKSSRPLSPVESIALAALTATLIVTTGVFIVEREVGPVVDAGASSPATTAPMARPPTTNLARELPPPSERPPTSTGTAPSVSTVQSVQTKPPPAPPTPPPATLAPPAPSQSPKLLQRDQGYLTVVTRVAADVFVNGVRVGTANQPIVAPCGRRFVRMKTPAEMPRGYWLEPGSTVEIACRDVTIVPVLPKPGIRPETGIAPHK